MHLNGCTCVPTKARRRRSIGFSFTLPPPSTARAYASAVGGMRRQGLQDTQRVVEGRASESGAKSILGALPKRKPIPKRTSSLGCKDDPSLTAIAPRLEAHEPATNETRNVAGQRGRLHEQLLRKSRNGRGLRPRPSESTKDRVLSRLESNRSKRPIELLRHAASRATHVETSTRSDLAVVHVRIRSTFSRRPVHASSKKKPTATPPQHKTRHSEQQAAREPASLRACEPASLRAARPLQTERGEG